MRSLLHIKLAEEYQNLPYQSEVQQLISTNYPSIEFFELDNYSAQEMVSYGQEMIQRSSLVLVVVESLSEVAPPGKLIRLFNQINREKPSHLQMVLLGRHPVVEKMLRSLGDKFRPCADTQQLASMAKELFV